MQTDSIAKGTFQIALASGLQYAVMGLFYIVVTKTNSLTQADIGVVSILTFISSLVLLATQLSLPTALAKFVSENVAKGQVQEAASISKTIFRTVIVLSMIGCAVAAIGSYQISEYLFGSSNYAYLVILMLGYTLAYSVVTLLSSALQGLLLFGRMALVTVLFIIVSRIVGAALAFVGTGVVGVVVGYVVGATVSLAVAVVFLRGKFSKTSLNSSVRPLLRFSFPLFLGSITLLILNWADVVIVRLLSGDNALTGVYYIAVNSVTALTVLWIPLSTTIMPAMSAKKGLNRSEDITEIIRISSRYIMYIVVPACVGLALVSSTAMNFFYGSGYIEGALALSILSIASIVTAFYAVVIAALTALGKTTQILKIYGVSALVSVVALVLAVLPFKTVGAASARFATQLTSLVLGFYVLRREVKVRIDSEGVWKAIVASAAFIPFILVFDAVWGYTLSVTLRLVAEIGPSVAIYAVCLYLLRALKSQDFD